MINRDPPMVPVANSSAGTLIQLKWLCFGVILVCVLAVLESRLQRPIFFLSRWELDHLGGEYGYIARSLYHDSRFADAMGNGTGATAWMPPALPCLFACFLYLFGTDHEFVSRVARRFSAAFWTCSSDISRSSASRAVYALKGLLDAAFILAIGFGVYSRLHGRQVSRHFWFLVVFWGIAILPYTIISYYERYGVSLSPLKMLCLVEIWPVLKQGRFGLFQGPRARWRPVRVNRVRTHDG